MKKTISVRLLLLAVVLLASTAVGQKVGSTSMQFLKVMPCARATAMGEAYSVLASGAEAVFWNPAGVAYAENTQVSLTYVRWIFDTQQGAVSAATSIGSFGAIGVQLQYVDFGAIDEALWVAPYNEDVMYPGITGRTFRPYSYMVGVTYAAQITNKFATGLSVKLAHESLYSEDMVKAVTSHLDTVDVKTWANGLMFDFGLTYNTGFRSVRLGASMQNFGANVSYGSEANPIPMSLRVGIAADVMGMDALLVPSEDNRLGVAFDLFQPNDYAQQAHFGAEYEYARIVALRAGYKFGYDADGFTAGLGVKQSVGGVQVILDYSFGTLHYNLGNVHRISVGAGF